MAISDYSVLYASIATSQPKPVAEIPEVTPVRLRPDARQITLAPLNKHSKGYITAHDFNDYRKKKFALSLLPYVETLFDQLLCASDYYYTLIHDDSPYSGGR